MSPGRPHPAIHVVAGAVTNAAGQVLIAQRPAGKHLAGGWEFPGGKLEPGEERRAGLARELREELGITITTPRPLIRVRHTYPSREVLLDVWVVRHYRGEPRGLDGQALRWCSQDELTTVELLPADGPIVRGLWLPERLTRASSAHYRVDDLRARASAPAPANASHVARDIRLQGLFCEGAGEAIAAAGAGAEFLVLRNELANGELAVLCGSVSVPVFARGIGLKDAWALGASGIHEIDD